MKEGDMLKETINEIQSKRLHQITEYETMLFSTKIDNQQMT